MRTRFFDLPSVRSAAALAMVLVLPLMGACSLSPTYSVQVHNESNRTLMATLERRPTINEVITMDLARVKAGTSALLGPNEAVPFERVYLVIGDRTDLHALPESVELRGGHWEVTIGASSMTDWGTYQLEVKKSKRPLADPDEADTPGEGE